MSEIASALAVRAEDASVVAELKAGSEEAYAWLVQQYHHPVYSLVYRLVNDPTDAADTTQEVFLKVFRGMKRFNGHSSLKTWIYRIALHEAANRRRWWFRHKGRETSMEAAQPESGPAVQSRAVQEALIDEGASPFESALHEEMRAHIEQELRHVAEPFRTALVLRDIEELSYEEIAEVTGTTLGTVKSRLTRGREALRKRLEQYVRCAAPELEVKAPARRAHGACSAEPEVVG